MGKEIIRWVVVMRTRKEHKCLGCLRDMPCGVKALVCKGITANQPFSFHLCRPCSEHLLLNQSKYEDIGIEPGRIGKDRAKEKRKRR